MKEVTLCGGPPGSCCAKVLLLEIGGVSIEVEDGDSIYLDANEWKTLKDKVKSGEL